MAQLSNEKLKELLVGPGHIEEAEFVEALAAAKTENVELRDVLVDRGLILDEEIGQLIARALGVPFINLRNTPIQRMAISVIPEVVARSRGVLAFAKSHEGLKLAMVDPKDLEMLVWIEKKTGEKPTPYYVTQKDLKLALVHYRKDAQGILEELMRRSADGDSVVAVQFIDALMIAGYENRASDIHLEPRENRSVLRFRIDGTLHDIVDVTPQLHEIFVARIKVLASMRTDEHRRPQDGQFTFRTEGERIDTRVSIIPITKGERVVLRLLAERTRQFSLENIGLLDENLSYVRAAIKKPWGMILATGPTGCGKTTTLYTLLKILNTREINIATIEDPVEYDMEGVNQIQVDPSADLTFATGLRSIVRQDPDMIMVGEIRDEETADIAVNAALTGHLVLSTFHANNTATTLVRLIEMGIEPYIIASTVNVVIAQRLVRRLCEQCRESYMVDAKTLRDKLPVELHKHFSEKQEYRLFRSRGCNVCGSTGFVGRIGIFEIMEISDALRPLITRRVESHEIEEFAKGEGMKTMTEDGLEKARLGITSIDEVLRSTRT